VDAVRPTTRWAVDLQGGRVFVPDVAEQISILHRFGPPKDLARAQLLAQFRVDSESTLN
jgi:hypothetical protein